MGPSAFDVVNQAIGLRIAARGRNMVRIYLLTGDTFNEQGEEVEQEATFDDYRDVEEEFITGDDGSSFMVRRLCFTPRRAEGDDGQHNNLFHSTYTIGGKACKLVIDEGNCENMVVEEAVRKLALNTGEIPYTIPLGVAQEGKQGNSVKMLPCEFFNWN
jgi:hypothetical protein